MSTELTTKRTTIFTAIETDGMRRQLAAVLPNANGPHGEVVNRYIAVFKGGVTRNPDILQCTPQSIYDSVSRCAQDGLQLDGREAALVKMGNVAQYMPMIAGLRKIAAKYGINIDSQVVRKSDVFKVWRDEKGVHFNHEPDYTASDEPAVAVYASAKLPTGEVMLEVMSRAQVEVIRQSSRAKNSGPWVNHWDEMARKTVGRRLWKQLPFYDMDGGEAANRVIEAMDAEYATPEPAAERPARQPGKRPSSLDVVAAAAPAEDEMIEGEATEVDTGEDSGHPRPSSVDPSDDPF